MTDLDTKEWLLTNGLGSFASGTVSDIRTRSYHGWLFAAMNPPSGRHLLLSHLEASLELSQKVIPLGSNFWGTGEINPQGYRLLNSFGVDPVPKWSWGENNWQVTRELIMPHCQVSGKEFTSSLLVKYTYEGVETAILKLRLLIADRDFHHQQLQTSELQFSQLIGEKQVCLQRKNSGECGIPWHLRWTQGDYEANGVWYWNYALPEETARGLKDREDLYSPGYLTIHLQPGDQVTLEAKEGFPEPQQLTLTEDSFAEAIVAEQKRLTQVFLKGKKTVSFSDPHTLLLHASDQFIAYRASISGPTVIAGYHWFNDWGRDTLIALPGLTLTPGRYDLAKGLLKTFGHYCRYGLIPNAFPDEDNEPIYNSIDAALWWIETLGLYLEATRDWDFLAEQYPVVLQIYKAFVGGTRYNIQVDSTDGLVSWDNCGVALTWMDAVVNGKPVTPRRGKPIEINALWYSALCWASRWAEILSERADVSEQGKLTKQANRYSQHAEHVKVSLQKFWNSQLGYFYDTIEPDDRRNSQIRPNAVIALSLAHCGFTQLQGQQILEVARSHLLTPYGLRSLSPSDPEYQGRYIGNGETRDRAYHQGTVWCWLIGAFVRSWQRFYPDQPLPFDWQPLISHMSENACVGSISEIFDGDKPHFPRGAIAQAWSVAEVLRHFPKS
ncbi:amylo-alpha-1,6-glucosidase [Calothrix sp. PCC 6303]|uniref:amylo-alpha-1,6-glucosidase n=1 Tax=Calothrix sp. PCC 6303 TaxID=1170562 RepID=UPI0002A0135D|nr:amylo-alpha-1,6-glucosidase [Calothrix sp. PCC 6303]AFZ03516.1 glycogen debranching enzyme [Calothrix sp. PCC 6303]